MPAFDVPTNAKLLAVIAAMLSLFVLERVFPVAPKLAGFARLTKNISLAAVNAILSPLIVLPLTLLATGYALQWRPQWLEGGLGFAFDTLVLDLWLYWWHRANHRLPFLWRFHEVHHLDETLDTTSAVRFHFGEVLLSSMARAVVILVLAVPFSSVVVFEAAIALAAIFHHSNLRLPIGVERALSAVIVTPSIHWVHHHAERRDTDSSYATVLSLWDRLFGSRSSFIRTPSMQIGVEGSHDVTLPNLLLRPFRSRRENTDS
jgi:sterol desaturase/sphingolipid hydroxylase (fatty acid hydroxylase superfamily)